MIICSLSDAEHRPTDNRGAAIHQYHRFKDAGSADVKGDAAESGLRQGPAWSGKTIFARLSLKNGELLSLNDAPAAAVLPADKGYMRQSQAQWPFAVIFYLRSFIMKQYSLFKGAATALVTPLNENGVDWAQFERLLNWQVEAGISALVICGTSGEGSTLSDEEHRACLKFAKEIVGDRVPLIAGTGSNDTAYAISLTEYACELGYDAMLVVTPYYNKATQNGLVKMFTAIADASTKPVILYNVPSRTGVNIEPSTYAKLADHPMIWGIKEAGGNISKIVETKALCGDKLDIWSGNDDQIVPLIACGGVGVISVLSNVLPEKTVEMCMKAINGDIKGAMDMQCDMLPLINALFCEVNPIPVKAAVAALGYCDNYVRLPLTPMEPEHELVLLEEMRKQGLDF